MLQDKKNSDNLQILSKEIGLYFLLKWAIKF
jgi:hypothetical protein